MATKLYTTNTAATYSTGNNTARANGTNTGWQGLKLNLTGAGTSFSTSASVATVAGPTNGLEILISGTNFALEWISEPLAADITISGTITFNVWMAENNMSANTGAQCIVERIDATGTISTISNSEKGTELPTTLGAQNWTATPTSTAMSRGDRIRVRVLGNDFGTMATGFTFSMAYGADSAGSTGDSWVQFNENLTFESDPAGSQLFLTDTASDVATADVDREAWTSRGGGSVNDVTNTTNGWTAPIQITDTAGGTAVTWWTRPLQAFTLGGKALANIRALESNTNANAAIRVEIAICNNDGSGAVVWASAASVAEAGAIDVATLCYPSGPDTAVNDGQRLRIRVFIDDINTAAMATGFTVTSTYNGTSAGAAGDTYVTFQQTLSEFVSNDNLDWLKQHPAPLPAQHVHKVLPVP